MPPTQPPPAQNILIICELCDARIPTSRKDAKQERFDHAIDEHYAAFMAVAPDDRSNYLHKCFRITNRMGKPESLPL